MGDRVTPVVVDDTRAAAVKDALQVCQGGLCAPTQPRAQHSGPLHASITYACMHACTHAEVQANSPPAGVPVLCAPRQQAQGAHHVLHHLQVRCSTGRLLHLYCFLLHARPPR